MATSTRPLLLVASCLGLGAAAAGPAPARWPVILAALAFAVLAMAWNAPPRAGSAAVCAAALGTGTAAGMVEHLAYRHAPLAVLAHVLEGAGPVEVRGVARRDAVPGDPRFVLLLDVDT